MKVLWFSNCVLSKQQSSGSGSWLFAMRDLISKDVELINLTDDAVGEITAHEGNGIREYLIPRWKTKQGVPSIENIQKIADIVRKETPDIIHIWGVEKYWALLFGRGYIKFDRVILEIQGVLSACTDVYYGGLTPMECRRLISMRGMIFKWSRHSYKYRTLQRMSLYEEELIKNFKNIAVQSHWTKDQLSAICNGKADFYYSLRPIRQEFYKAEKWQKQGNDNPVVFCSMANYPPYKGFHFLLRAMYLLRLQYPTITLRIAGSNLYTSSVFAITGYERFLLQEIKALNLEDNIHFCGKLNASQLVKEIQNANVVINPSMVESYSAAAAEALYLGAPTVLAYSGAMVNFSEEKPVALYYNPMDYRSMVARIRTLFEDETIRNTITANAIEVLAIKCSSDKVKACQLETYNRIVDK